MGTIAFVGKSNDPSGFQAGAEAAREALAGLPGGQADLLLVFATASYDQDSLVRGIRSKAEGVPMSGCSGEGVITLRDSAEVEHAVGIMAVSSDLLSFHTYQLQSFAREPVERGAELAGFVNGIETDDVVGILVFPDGLGGNCLRFLESLAGNLNKQVPVVGGTAGDSFDFHRTFQYHGDHPISDGVSAVVITGSGELEIGVSHGCKPIGMEREITRSADGWVYEIDGRPAWGVFKEYLDGDPRDLNAEGTSHLCIGEPLDPGLHEAYGPFVIRSPFKLDKETGGLFFPGGGLATGQRIQLTRRDREEIIAGARDCARGILERRGGRRPDLVFQFDCAGRGRVLFGREACPAIVEPLQEILGVETPWLGFHTFGEIAPIGNRMYYHNYSVALCAVYDSI